MRRLALLVGGLAVLVGLWVIGARVTTAQVHSNDANIALVDNCDPATFNAAIPDVCAQTPHKLDTTFAEFLDLLFSPLAANIIGHPAWNFSPGYVSIRSGQTVRGTNVGGEVHTFTEVTDFGGGVVPALNGVGGPPGTVPLVLAPECSSSTSVLSGETVHVTGLAPGVHKFMCCIHPWMRAVVDVEN